MTPEVKVGQIWQDNDRRMWKLNPQGVPVTPRLYRVFELLPGAARMEQCGGFKQTTIKYSYMRGTAADDRRTGWSLYQDI